MTAEADELPDASFAGTFRPGARVEPCGDQWAPFGGMDEDRLEALASLFAEASWPLQSEFWRDESVAAHVLPVPESEPHGQLRSAGYGRHALMIACDGELRLASMFPADFSPEAYWFALDSVDMAENRLQFRVNGRLQASSEVDGPSTPISWFALDEPAMRHFWRKGRVYEIGLVGLCYACAVAENHREEIAVTDAMREVWLGSGIPELAERAQNDTVEFDLSELTTLLADDSEGGKPDDAFFRGKVLSARKLRAPIADCGGWSLKVELIDWGDPPLVLTLIVTEHAWGRAQPPRRGQYVEGWAWLQGNVRKVHAELPHADPTTSD